MPARIPCSVGASSSAFHQRLIRLKRVHFMHVGRRATETTRHLVFPVRMSETSEAKAKTFFRLDLAAAQRFAPVGRRKFVICVVLPGVEESRLVCLIEREDVCENDGRGIDRKLTLDGGRQGPSGARATWEVSVRYGTMGPHQPWALRKGTSAFTLTVPP